MKIPQIHVVLAIKSPVSVHSFSVSVLLEKCSSKPAGVAGIDFGCVHKDREGQTEVQ